MYSQADLSLNPYSTGIRLELHFCPLRVYGCPCLNPYSTGIRIEALIMVGKMYTMFCFNPYSTGIRIEEVVVFDAGGIIES